MLIGRDPEQRLIESLLGEARRGASAALVIRGEPGDRKDGGTRASGHQRWCAGASLVFLKLGVSSRVELARQALQPVAVGVTD